MAKYILNNKEVTEEEFNKEVFKAVEESPFFLDEVITGFNSFFGENRAEEDILNNILNPNLKGSKLKDEWKETTVNMNKSKGDNIFKDVTWKSAELSPENKEKLEWIRVLAKKSAEKEKLTKDKNTIINTQNFKLTDILDIVKAESEEELEDILKRNMNIGAPDYAYNPATMSHTGGTVFEKVQDATINPNTQGGQIRLLGDLAEKITNDQSTWAHKKLEWKGELPPYKDMGEEISREYYKTLENIYLGNYNKGKFTVDNFGVKETENKTDYSEIDWQFITQLAERMNKNKDKYDANNWKRPINVELLKQSLLRHVIAVLNGDYEDDGRPQGHIEAIALNAQMINYQLKNK